MYYTILFQNHQEIISIYNYNLLININNNNGANMKTNKIIINFIFTLIIIVFVYSYKIYFSSANMKKIYKDNIPSYEEKYNALKENYELLKENYDFIPAEIINLSVKKINNLFLINKGSNSRIKENSFVVNEDGLVGEIVKVYKKYSIARLITSNNTNISVEINDCYGTLKVKNNKYYVSDLINCGNVKKNDPVFTSKYNYSSSNILIGKINDIRDDKLYINYSFNPYKVRYVGVINDNN